MLLGPISIGLTGKDSLMNSLNTKQRQRLTAECHRGNNLQGPYPEFLGSGHKKVVRWCESFVPVGFTLRILVIVYITG
jgi:hypothetical protein